jgi:hypothetical protein
VSGELGVFSDPQAAVCDVLADLVQAAYAGPRGLAAIQAGVMPAVRVYRTGGADDLVNDTAAVKVDVFAGTAATALSVAQQCQQVLISGPFTSGGPSFATADGCIDRASTLSAPQLVTDPGAAVTQCVTASYRIWMRRPSSQGG